MKKGTLFLSMMVCLLFLSVGVFAQDDEKKGFDIDRLVIEPQFGLNVGNGIVQLQLAPMVGYRFTDKLILGAGPSYEFISYRPYFSNDRFKINLFGARAFARYTIFENFFAQGEYEFLKYTDNFSNPTNTQTTTSRLPVGGGYRQSLGGRGAINVMVLYDILYALRRSDLNNTNVFTNSGYNGLIFRVSIGI